MIWLTPCFRRKLPKSFHKVFASNPFVSLDLEHFILYEIQEVRKKIFALVASDLFAELVKPLRNNVSIECS